MVKEFTMQTHTLSSKVAVGGQIRAEDMVALGRQGFTAVMNHRPDGEEVGQPDSRDLEAAARAAGLNYHAAPVRGLPDPAAVAATAAALESLGADGRLLLFCRSGMRSAAAWAMAEAGRGADADALRNAAATAGYDTNCAAMRHRTAAKTGWSRFDTTRAAERAMMRTPDDVREAARKARAADGRPGPRPGVFA
jgi:uncharacterized protein (TIGR01244 family)